MGVGCLSVDGCRLVVVAVIAALVVDDDDVLNGGGCIAVSVPAGGVVPVAGVVFVLPFY